MDHPERLLGEASRFLPPGDYEIQQVQGDGDTCFAWTISSPLLRFFVKSQSCGSHSRAVFEAEAQGLKAIRETGTIRTPRVVGIGTLKDLDCQCDEAVTSFIVLEHLDLRQCMTPRAETAFGVALARLHSYVQTERLGYGFHLDNWLGSTRQVNAWQSDWTRFYSDRLTRLAALLPENDSQVKVLVAELVGRMKSFFAGIYV